MPLTNVIIEIHVVLLFTLHNTKNIAYHITEVLIFYSWWWAIPKICVHLISRFYSNREKIDAREIYMFYSSSQIIDFRERQYVHEWMQCIPECWLDTNCCQHVHRLFTDCNALSLCTYPNDLQNDSSKWSSSQTSVRWHKAHHKTHQ